MNDYQCYVPLTFSLAHCILSFDMSSVSRIILVLNGFSARDINAHDVAVGIQKVDAEIQRRQVSSFGFSQSSGQCQRALKPLGYELFFEINNKD